MCLLDLPRVGCGQLNCVPVPNNVCAREMVPGTLVWGTACVEVVGGLIVEPIVTAAPSFSIIMLCLIIHTKMMSVRYCLYHIRPETLTMLNRVCRTLNVFPHLSEHTLDVVQKESLWVLAACWACHEGQPPQLGTIGEVVPHVVLSVVGREGYRRCSAV